VIVLAIDRKSRAPQRRVSEKFVKILFRGGLGMAIPHGRGGLETLQKKILDGLKLTACHTLLDQRFQPRLVNFNVHRRLQA
jgi:hypothetical protein